MQIELEDLKRIDLRPGDVFIYRPEAPFSMEQADQMHKAWRREFPDNRLVFVPAGELFVLRDEAEVPDVDAG